MNRGHETHWIEYCEDAVIQPNASGSLGLTLQVGFWRFRRKWGFYAVFFRFQGGSEFGQFVFLGPLNENEILTQRGRLQPEDVILEVQEKKVGRLSRCF